MSYPASVHLDVGLVPHGAELVVVVAEQLEREVVVPGVVVVPGHRVDAGVSEVLVSFLAQQTEERHLNRSNRVVGDLREKQVNKFSHKSFASTTSYHYLLR